MRGGLFWRIFSAILAAVLITVVLFTGIMSTSLQQVRQGSYESEVRMQAYEIANYMANTNQLSPLRDNLTMQFIVRQKISEIHDRYNADIWIVNFPHFKSLEYQIIIAQSSPHQRNISHQCFRKSVFCTSQRFFL